MEDRRSASVMVWLPYNETHLVINAGDIHLAGPAFPAFTVWFGKEDIRAYVKRSKVPYNTTFCRLVNTTSLP